MGPCVDAFALLDDNLADTPGVTHSTRLYTQLAHQLSCMNPELLAPFWQEVRHHMLQGLHAVVLADYEWGVQLANVTSRHVDASHPPQLRVLLFRQLQQLTQAQTQDWIDEQLKDVPRYEGFGHWQASTTQQQFVQDVQTIRQWIESGDTYQANLTYRLNANAYGHPIGLYDRLRQRQPVAYGALIKLLSQDGVQAHTDWVLSRSPELFLRSQNGQIQAKPMKGTAPRSTNSAQDQQTAQWLQQDQKNRAENVMIVDLLRNDLGRVAQTGTVKVPQLFGIESYATVHQMISLVTARLKPYTTFAQVMQALFPCGSITGAPKVRTMQLIDEIESTQRGLYTGAIGWVDLAQTIAGEQSTDESFCLSVAIRTLTLKSHHAYDHTATAGVGGGIVYDSVGADEWEETQVKTRYMRDLVPSFELFETMLAQRETERAGQWRIALLDHHLDRLQRSAQQLGFMFKRDDVRACLDQALHASAIQAQQARCKLQLNALGQAQAQLQELQALPAGEQFVLLSDEPLPVHEQSLLNHKTTLRTAYDAAIKHAQQHGAVDVLFFNQQGALTEGARTNVFVFDGSQWFTPPPSAGVLPGVMRGIQIQQLGAIERDISRQQLLNAQQVAVCNALRGWLPVRVKLTQ